MVVPAVRRHAQPKANIKVVVADDPQESVILQHQCPLATGKVEPVDIVVVFPAIVQGHQNLVWHIWTHMLHARLHAFQWRQILYLTCLQIDGVETPILVAALVLEVEQVLVRVRPTIRPNTASDIMRDRAGGSGIVWRGPTHTFSTPSRGATKLR